MPSFRRGQSPNRSIEQVQNLSNTVYSYDWYTFATGDSDITSARDALNLFHHEGGWYFLSFLDVLRYHVDQRTQKLFDFFQPWIGEEDMFTARLVALCLDRMSLRPGLGMDPPESVDHMASRVQMRLELYRSQTSAVRRFLLRTLEVVFLRLRNKLSLLRRYDRWRTQYQQTCKSLAPTTMLNEEDTRDFAYSTMTVVLFYSCFLQGIPAAVDLCLGGVTRQTGALKATLIHMSDFALNDRLFSDAIGTQSIVDPYLSEGVLWAKGLGCELKWY